MTPTLRPYQSQLADDINRAWSAGYSNVLASLATGGGKSVVVSAGIVAPWQGQSCVVAHRQELVGQMSLHLASAGVKHRVIAPTSVIAAIRAEHRIELGRVMLDPHARATVAGVDTLVSRRDKLNEWARQVTLWVIDEAHHVLRENKWGTVAELFGNARGLGVTATPERADGKGLGRNAHGVFDVLVSGPSMSDLIKTGALTDYRIVMPESDFDVNRLKVTASGDYSKKQMREAAKESRIVGDVVEAYRRWADGKPGITFATDVETANHIAERFNHAGIPAAAISAETPGPERSELIRRFRRREILQLVNVDLFGEGFDVPAVEVVTMARPTQSLGLYLQQFGRVLRPLAGKTHGLVIDHVGNVTRHGLPDKPRAWTLAARDKRKSRPRDPEEIPLTVCLECMSPYERTNRACPYCGAEPEIQTRRAPEQVDGDLILLDSDVLAQLRAATELEAPASVADRVASAAGPIAAKRALNQQTERIEEQQRLRHAIALWAGYQRALGRPDHESYRRFYHWHGADVLTVQTLSRVDMAAIRERIEAQLPEPALSAAAE